MGLRGNFLLLTIHVGHSGSILLNLSRREDWREEHHGDRIQLETLKTAWHPQGNETIN